jgi:hypothetical protein
MSFAAMVIIMVVAGPQPPSLDGLASGARQAFLSRDFGRLIETRAVVRLALPRHPVMPVVRGAAAAAILGAHASRTTDEDVSIVRSAVVEGRHGYVELSRRFRLVGTQQLQRARVLLGAVLRDGAWQVTDVLVVEAPPSP